MQRGTIDFERELNPAQRRAATAGDGAHLVVAGAGSGKTRTLVYRVAHLVEQGVAPESILLLTFTRRAAAEMLRRASRILDERCRRVAGGTFHSFANTVLRRHGEQLGYAPGFTILDRSDAADLVGVLRSEAGYDKRRRRFPRKDTLLDLLSKAVNTGRPLAELVEESYSQFAREVDAIAELGKLYTERKRQQNVMDYDDLLVNLRDLLAGHEEVRRRVGATFRFIMVDEYQDTNRLQAHIAALLASSHGNLMVVGDDAQSIYAFRGASFRNILDFPQLFPEAQVTLLEQNYRSTQPILDLANAVLAEAREKYSKTLYTEVEGDERPLLVRTPDDYAQSAFVCEQVLALREEGVPLAEMAVLCRAAWHTAGLELELANRNIPFRKFGGLKLVEAAHVKDLTALLKMALNPLDGPAWFRFLQLYPGIGPATAQRLAAAVAAAGDLSPLTAPRLSGKRYAAGLAELARRLPAIGDEGRPLAARVEQAVELAGDLLPNKYDDAGRRLRDFEALTAIAERYDSAEALLTDLAIEPPELVRAEGGGDDEDEWLTLSTVHSAKGLEWRAVFVLNLNEGQFPHFRSLDDPESYEEERRLLYVALTRAERHLYLLRPEELPRRGGFGGALADLSPFLSELAELPRLVEECSFSLEEGGAAWREGGPAAPGEDERMSRISDYFGDR